MEITLSNGIDGKVVVRTSLGHCETCDNMEMAVVYANGLQAGYKAAVSKLGTCHGFRSEVR